MSIWTAINPWGEIDDLKKQIEDAKKVRDEILKPVLRHR